MHETTAPSFQGCSDQGFGFYIKAGGLASISGFKQLSNGYTDSTDPVHIVATLGRDMLYDYASA